MEKFTLDNKSYNLDELPEEARKLANQAALTSEFIEKLEARIAIARTAQARYVEHLKASIGKATPSKSGK
ncbi:hypothetical protein [Marinobacter salexigens]|jgi:uncharacterized protein YdbL (DUF1318 family)|uniref:Uncharacterized protein n=1 Tax=Marinobacter salexigens TaxID=1925763 RepID=A0ABS6ACH9_9GAMM|nr:hypothetical protein [Marinobacter salexigens]MBU2875746.1 hypothetical protein [Marinobacter salexigens]